MNIQKFQRELNKLAALGAMLQAVIDPRMTPSDETISLIKELNVTYRDFVARVEEESEAVADLPPVEEQQ